MADELVVPFAAYQVEDPWAVPEPCRPVVLRRATDGAACRLRTEVAAYFDGEFLNAVFSGEDEGVVATHFEHDAPLYEEDVVELFLSPGDLHTYFEIEVNPLGTTFDARIISPDGVRATMKADVSWNCDGLLAAVRREPGRLAIVVRIPFVSLGAATPGGGEVWRGNLFRIDRDPVRGNEFMAWQPTRKTPPDFHLTAAFGAFRFGRRDSR